MNPFIFILLLALVASAKADAICNDGWYSHSTGSGTCSHHGGVAAWTTVAIPNQQIVKQSAKRVFQPVKTACVDSFTSGGWHLYETYGIPKVSVFSEEDFSGYAIAHMVWCAEATPLEEVIIVVGDQKAAKLVGQIFRESLTGPPIHSPNGTIWCGIGRGETHVTLHEKRTEDVFSLVIQYIPRINDRYTYFCQNDNPIFGFGTH